jgi:hypothetical protein
VERRVLAIINSALLLLICQTRSFGQVADPLLLTFDEIQRLYQDDDLPAPLRDKLRTLLTTPFVRNSASDNGMMPLKPNDPQTAKMLRVAQWNIERGLEFDAVRFAFTDPKKFNALMEDKGSKADDDERAKIREQIAILQQADLLVLNEVDWGVNRTLFRNVAEELASALNMNYAYGVEFVEVDPLTMGLDQQVVAREVEDAYKEPDDDRQGMLARVKQIMTPDPERYHGLHGTAILSPYRLENVRLTPFLIQGHDWYKDERSGVGGESRGQVQHGDLQGAIDPASAPRRPHDADGRYCRSRASVGACHRGGDALGRCYVA